MFYGFTDILRFKPSFRSPASPDELGHDRPQNFLCIVHEQRAPAELDAVKAGISNILHDHHSFCTTPARCQSAGGVRGLKEPTPPSDRSSAGLKALIYPDFPSGIVQVWR